MKPNKKMIRIKQSEDIYEESEEEGLGHDEEYLIDGQRQELLANNEKFMKEVKLKHEEKRKALAEAASPKKKPEA